MGAMQTMMGSDQAGSRSTPGRPRRNDGKPRELARQAAGATPDEATKALIYRQSRCGFSVEVLATQFGLGRSQIEHIIHEMRARRLLEAKLEFVSDPSFDDPAAVAEILGPSPEPAVSRAPAGPGHRKVCPPIWAACMSSPCCRGSRNSISSAR